jgi:hypothetical protein
VILSIGYLLVSLTYRYASGHSQIELYGNTHVGNYIPAETGCLWFIGTGAAAYTYAAGNRPTAL